MTKVFLTTTQKRKAKAEAEYVASLGPKGPKPTTERAAFRRATPSQTLVGVDQHGVGRAGSKLHAPGCVRLDNIWHASRMATDEELASREGCSFCR
jgi:hypothetical protein